MTDVVMPRLSDSMEEGTIVRWLKADGDAVARGDELVEIETDKATMTYEADSDGVLSILAQEGDTLPIGEPIARIGDAPEAAPEAEDASEPDDEAPAPEPAPAAAEPSEPEPDVAPASTAEPKPAAEPKEEGERVKASPVARRMAHELAVDLGSLSGSGPGGRVVKADVEAASGGNGDEPAQQEEPTTETIATAGPTEPAPSGKGEVTVEELSRIQRTIARRTAESRATVPDFTLTMEIDMEDAVALRAQLKSVAGEDAVLPSLNDLVVKACALALREHPRVNGAYRDGRFELHSRVNVGVAVAGEDALIVPTLFDADQRSLGELARESRRLAERVRDGSITPPEVSGATFSVSNLGMLGVTRFTAVINPPQAAILAVGAIESRAVVHEGEVVARQRMDVTLSVDHRILYGADAARFLGRVRELLESPLEL